MALEAPPASSPAVHNVMVANTSRDTKPELRVRRMLREAGYPGYRLHWRVDDANGRYVCRPDITYPGRKLAIFVHGCFWHRCPKCDLGLPKTNVEYWRQKFEGNIQRDRRKESELVGLGWYVLTIWECEVGNWFMEEERGKLLFEGNGSTITGDSWRNVLREFRQRHSDS